MKTQIPFANCCWLGISTSKAIGPVTFGIKEALLMKML